MADLITTLGNRDRTLIDDYAIAADTAYSSVKIQDLIKTFDSAVRCSIALSEPIGAEAEYDSTYLTILAGEIGGRVLVTAPNGLGVVIAASGTVYTVKTVYVCTWVSLTGKPFESLSAEDFTVDNDTLRYVDKWTAPINGVDDRKQEKVPESGSAGTGRYAGKRDPVTGDAVWEELDEFSLVNSVNGVFPDNMPAGKNIQIDGSEINLDDSAGTPVTIKDAVINIADLAEVTLAAGPSSNTLPVTGVIRAVLQTVRNCLKWLAARFDAAGNANTANKLTHARTFLTDLAAVAATNFDGSADNVHGVTGILPVASGGTGLDTAPAMLTDLASATEASPLDVAPRPGVTGILPVASGGTGLDTAPAMLTDLASATEASPLDAAPRPGVLDAQRT